MIARRLGALVLTVALITGAFLVRSRVIDGEGDGDTPDTSATPTLVCLDELADACRSLGDLDGMPLVIESAQATLQRLRGEAAGSVIWLTLAPFPEMAALLRADERLPAFATEQTPLASSPLSLVVRSADASSVIDTCAAAAIPLRCLGDLVDLNPTFAPTSSAIGTLGVASALVAFGGGSFDATDFDLLTWAGPLKRAGAQSLSGGTAIGTIQTRATFGVAVGAEAELAEARRSSFEVLYADPMVRLDVELMVPEGTDTPDDLTDRIQAALTDSGWEAAGAGENGVPDPGVVLAARTFWEGL